MNFVVFVVMVVVFDVIMGLWFDKIKCCKFFIMIVLFVVGVGVIFFFFVNELWMFIIFVVIGGVVFGIYMVVDGVFMVEVLFDCDDVVCDLGFFNVVNFLLIVFVLGIGVIFVKMVGYFGLFIVVIILVILGLLCII